MKSDFQKAKIYKITNDFNDHVFIGSTCDTLPKKLSKHKSDSQCKNKPLYKLMNEIGFERFRIQLICDFPCEDKYQLSQKTSEYIRLYGKELNLRCDELKQRRKQQKEEQHKTIKLKVKEELEKRINKFREINSIILCDCGCEVVKRGLKAHQKSKKHLDLMESKIPSSNSD